MVIGAWQLHMRLARGKASEVCSSMKFLRTQQDCAQSQACLTLALFLLDHNSAEHMEFRKAFDDVSMQ